MSGPSLRERREARVEEPWGWLDGYAPPTGRRDEMLDGWGSPRPVWRDFIRRLAALPPDEVARRFAASERTIRDTGVSYRVHGDEAERTWPLGPLPLLIDGAEWRDLAAGIVQRAALMEAMLADLFGEGRLVRDGIVPASLVAGCPEFLRPLHSVRQRSRRFLHLYAADLVRGPDGGWQIVADRTQAPSGMGYALENRLVLSRAYPDLYGATNVERLAPFFQDFRAGLAASAERSDPRICLLTPGAYSDTYFEQSYLARYLNLLLVEGDDLIMRDGRLHVRTIAGLKLADVIWRRVDSDFVDPLELNPASRLGVPGLVETIRNGALAIGNMPGSGLPEAAGFGPFLPAIAEALLGERLRLPEPRSWWCGDPESRAHAEGALDRLTLTSAYRPAAMAGEPDRAALRAALADRPFDVVAREPVVFSTAPALEGERLIARPFSLRVFAAWTPSGWAVMPGGLARYAERPEATPLAMGSDVRSVDAWVVSDAAVQPLGLAPPEQAVRIRRVAGHLPSRAADNLFWLGRYIERAESVVRLVRALLNVVGDASADADAATARIRLLLLRWGSVEPEDETPVALARAALADPLPARSVRSHVLSARTVAASLRERLPAVSWRPLTSLADTLALPGDAAPSAAELLALADGALVSLSALAGFTHETMNRAAGWHFVHMGRRVERALNTTQFTRMFAGDDADPACLSVLLDLVDAQVTFGSRYILGTAVGPARDIAFLDPYNPRSVAFQVTSLARHLGELPDLSTDGMPEPQRRAARKLASDIGALDAADLKTEVLDGIEERIAALSELIATRYFPGGPDAVRPEKLTGLA